VSAVGIEPTTY